MLQGILKLPVDFAVPETFDLDTNLFGHFFHVLQRCLNLHRLPMFFCNPGQNLDGSLHRLCCPVITAVSGDNFIGLYPQAFGLFNRLSYLRTIPISAQFNPFPE